MTYDDLSTYVSNTLALELETTTTIHDSHVWVFYLNNLNQSQ